MKIYVSGICGTAMGALAIFAKKAGMKVVGSDKNIGAVAEELKKNQIDYKIGEQDGEFLRKKYEEDGIDWFVYTSALPKDHTELILAKKLGIKISKRDELINTIMKETGLKMVAVAGTHGKTTTTSMIIWTCLKLNIPISYLVGSTLPFAKTGEYDANSKYLVYEADEYDRNFLHFHPEISAITVVDYDHPDIYPTKESYDEAFMQFIRQSKKTIIENKIDRKIKLAGKVRKKDASLAKETVMLMAREMKIEISEEKIVEILNQFPGAHRRFEKIAENIYSDYAHHPEEIKATLEIAKEQAKNDGNKGVVAIYEPHQNTRQHEIFDDYKNAFLDADKIFWLPTFLTRENPELFVYQPRDFIRNLANGNVAYTAECNEELAKEIQKLAKNNYLVLLMTAGPADNWLRKNI